MIFFLNVQLSCVNWLVCLHFTYYSKFSVELISICILFGQDSEQIGNEMPEGPDDLKEEGQDDQNHDSHDESVVVDADSTDGAVFVNGNEAEEEWGTNNAGNPSA